jgi:hypothetical protein
VTGYELSPEVFDARRALTAGLADLRWTVLEMFSVGLRGDGGGTSRTRHRPPTNDAPARRASPTGPTPPTRRPRSGRWSSGRRPARPRRSA